MASEEEGEASGGARAQELGVCRASLALPDRLSWACLGDSQGLPSSAQLGVRVLAKINPVREGSGGRPGLLESREGEDSTTETCQLL